MLQQHQSTHGTREQQRDTPHAIHHTRRCCSQRNTPHATEHAVAGRPHTHAPRSASPLSPGHRAARTPFTSTRPRLVSRRTMSRSRSTSSPPPCVGTLRVAAVAVAVVAVAVAALLSPPFAAFPRCRLPMVVVGWGRWRCCCRRVERYDARSPLTAATRALL